MSFRAGRAPSGGLRILMCLIAVLGGGAGHAAEPIHGAGATFPAPVYLGWAQAYAAAGGAALSYEAVGSGQGIARIRAREVDFGASDAPLSAEELAGAGLAQFPAVIGGVVPVINIAGIKPGALHLSGPVLADIYLGRIQKWNAPAIAELNPGLSLPNANITVVHRSDFSGSSLLWTRYLSRVSPDWQAGPGASALPAWPTGVGGVGNEGVASYVQRTRFAIGYVEYAYARAHRLSDVSLRNHDGAFVRASRESFHAAAAAADWSDLARFQQLPAEPPGAKSWPVTGASFILVPAAGSDGERAREVLKFFEWSLQHGAGIAHELDYELIPEAAIQGLPALWRAQIHDGKGAAVWP